MDPETLGSLISDVYEAAINPAHWDVFLDRFARAVESPAVALILQDLRNPSGSAAARLGFDPLWERRYEEYFGGINVWIERAPHLFRPGLVTTSDRVITSSELMKTEFYNDFLRPQGHFYSYGAVLAQEESVITNIAAMRPQAAGPFGDDEVALLRELMPHLQTAIRVRGRLATVQRRADGLAEALNHMAQGVMLVDSQGKLQFMNRSAEDQLRAADGLSAPAGRLAAVRGADNDRLRALIESAAGSRRPTPSGGTMRVSRFGAGPDFTITVSPLRPGTALVLVADPRQASAPKARVLEELLSLTAAESRVAKSLAEGMSIADIADGTGVSPNTVRSHVKQIFAKTRVSRQSDLIRLVMAVAPPGC